MKAKNAAAVTLALLFIFALLFSLFFVIVEADHDCAHDDCFVCRVLCSVENALSKIFLLLIASGVAAIALFSMILFHRAFIRRAFFATPVAMKVKITD